MAGFLICVIKLIQVPSSPGAAAELIRKEDSPSQTSRL